MQPTDTVKLIKERQRDLTAAPPMTESSTKMKLDFLYHSSYSVIFLIPGRP